MSEPAGLGLSVFAGRAVAVIVSGTRAEPAIALRHWLELGDPWVPESFHPHHRELGDTGEAGRAARIRGCAAANASVRRAIANLLEEMRAHGFAPSGAMLVVDRIRDPARAPGGARAVPRGGGRGARGRATLRAFSHSVGTPWRAPEKNAALGAWLALH